MADDDRQMPGDQQPDEPDDQQPDEPDDQQPDELDETRPYQPQEGLDSSPVTPWSGAPGEPEPDDTATVADGGDDTAVMPPAGSDRWTARAGVPPAAPGEPVESYAQDQEGRGWWVPALLGLVGLLLLGILGAGVWLILRAREPAPTPPGPTPAPAPTTASPTPPATTAAGPTPTLPAPVRVPPVVGLTRADAQRVLETFGLTYQVQERVDPDSQPGRVIGVVPPEGTLVPPGSQVTLIVAIAPPTTAAASPTPAASPSG